MANDDDDTKSKIGRTLITGVVSIGLWEIGKSVFRSTAEETAPETPHERDQDDALSSLRRRVAQIEDDYRYRDRR